MLRVMLSCGPGVANRRHIACANSLFIVLRNSFTNSNLSLSLFHMCKLHGNLIVTLGAHAQRGLHSWFVCLSVSTLILALQATRRPISDTSGFRTTRA